MSARRGFGSVRRLPSGKWQARYRGADGTRFTAPLLFTAKADAQRWLAAAETDMARGEWHDPRAGDLPYADWSSRWLAVKVPNLAPSTADLYRYLLRRHIAPAFGSTQIGRVTPVHVQAWLAGLHETGLSPATVAKAYRLLSASMDGAVDAGLIPRSPCTIKGAGTERHPEMQMATPEQVARLVEVVEPRWKAMILTAAYGGLRWGELAGLRRMDVDLETGTIRVVRKLAEVNGTLSFSPPKSKAGRRTVGVPSFVIDALFEHLSRFSESGSQGLVFPAAEGGPLRRSNFRRRVWQPATAEVGVIGLRFHDLRHTAATLAAASGASLRAIMSRIGHNSSAAAIRYQHEMEGQDTDIVRFLERFKGPDA